VKMRTNGLYGTAVRQHANHLIVLDVKFRRATKCSGEQKKSEGRGRMKCHWQKFERLK